MYSEPPGTLMTGASSLPGGAPGVPGIWAFDGFGAKKYIDEQSKFQLFHQWTLGLRVH